MSALESPQSVDTAAPDRSRGEAAGVHTAIVARPLAASGSFEARVAGLPRDGRFWLDSAQEGLPLGRFSFAGAEPYAILRGYGDRNELLVKREVRPDLPVAGRHGLSGPSLPILRRLLAPAARRPVDAAPRRPLDLPFTGGVVLALGYEAARQLDRVRLRQRSATPLPDLTALFVDRLWVRDHLEGRVYAVASGFASTPEAAEAAARRAADELLRRPPGETGAPDALRRRAPMLETREPADHAKDVAEVKERIRAGDVYQACLTRRRVHRSDEDAWALYRRLRRANPAPFGAYLELPDTTVLGSSPERFLRVSADGWVESRPIKGTRPRGATPEEDRRLRAELAASEKDRAENLMIVDLVRNDLGRVCELGSVHVPELMAIEDYASVFQMVSTIRGRLAPGRDALDAVAAAFPPGSMTGAPKLAAMELLDRLEPSPRGLYAGALGYLDLAGGCDLSVVIRTAFVGGGQIAFHTGGGIVADSDADEEWSEGEDKLRLLLEALV